MELKGIFVNKVKKKEKKESKLCKYDILNVAHTNSFVCHTSKTQTVSSHHIPL